jgi:hypothetical protein
MSSEEPPTRDSTLRYKVMPNFLGNSLSTRCNNLNPDLIEFTYFSQYIFETISYSNPFYQIGLAEFDQNREYKKNRFQN